MQLEAKTIYRVILASIIVLSAIGLVFAPGQGNARLNHEDRALGDMVGKQVAPPSNGTTVIATQGQDNEGYTADLIAIGPSGELLYHNGTYGVYFDVDPAPTGKNDVLYIASENADPSTCAVDRCSRSVIERLNFSTGNVEQLYSGVTPNHLHSRWHDVDRINATHYVVAGIEEDRVFIVNVETDEITWQWNASSEFPPSSGGPADDWTHLNNVELLDDGRITVSLRNHDQVIFLHPNGTIDEDWTLGADDYTSILYEQHNPDYIPAENGGPALVVAGSENNRVVEYQRADGQWVQSWVWSDKRLNWPRDADRLPNGHTLIADSLGDRVLEVNRNGEVVWSVPMGIPYDAERLDTGDESTGGPSAVSADLKSSTHRDLLSLLPSKPIHGLAWVLPASITPLQFFLVIFLDLAVGLLIFLEVRVRFFGGETDGSPA